MSRIYVNTRNYVTPFNGEGVCWSVGFDTRVANVVHWYRTIKTSAMAGDFPSSDPKVAEDGAHRFQLHRISTSQKRRHHERFRIPPFHVQQQSQMRHFVFDSRKSRKVKAQKDPFKVLKVPKESLYKDVKKKFLRIAMNNHPDMHAEGLSEKEQKVMRDKFIEARMAFERLEEDLSDGKAILVEERIDREENFDSWFHNETGLKNPFDVDIDPETMKEVAEMTDKLGGKQGMERDGGMWALARMVTSAVKKGGDAASILRLESGDVKARPGTGPDGSLRRPRRR